MLDTRREKKKGKKKEKICRRVQRLIQIDPDWTNAKSRKRQVHVRGSSDVKGSGDVWVSGTSEGLVFRLLSAVSLNTPLSDSCQLRQGCQPKSHLLASGVGWKPTPEPLSPPPCVNAACCLIALYGTLISCCCWKVQLCGLRKRRPCYISAVTATEGHLQRLERTASRQKDQLMHATTTTAAVASAVGSSVNGYPSLWATVCAVATSRLIWTIKLGGDLSYWM